MPSRAAATWPSACVSTPPVTAAVFTMDMVIPFVVEGWHAPAGRRSCEPWPLAQARQDRERHRRWVPKEPGPGRQVVSQDNQRRQPNSRSGRDPGHRPYAPTRPNHRKQGRSTIHILPAGYLRFANPRIGAQVAHILSVRCRPYSVVGPAGASPGNLTASISARRDRGGCSRGLHGGRAAGVGGGEVCPGLDLDGVGAAAVRANFLIDRPVASSIHRPTAGRGGEDDGSGGLRSSRAGGVPGRSRARCSAGPGGAPWRTRARGTCSRSRSRNKQGIARL